VRALENLNPNARGDGGADAPGQEVRTPSKDDEGKDRSGTRGNQQGRNHSENRPAALRIATHPSSRIERCGQSTAEIFDNNRAGMNEQKLLLMHEESNQFKTIP
jgi:hypothetical protein